MWAKGKRPDMIAVQARRRHTRIVISAAGLSPTGRTRISCQLRWERPVVGTKIHFMAERAPCGKIVPGDHYEDTDGHGLVLRGEYYQCGCRRMYQEYHDGSLEIDVIRHDGKAPKPEVGLDHGC